MYAVCGEMQFQAGAQKKMARRELLATVFMKIALRVVRGIRGIRQQKVRN
jgi:hypothetical protein